MWQPVNNEHSKHSTDAVKKLRILISEDDADDLFIFEAAVSEITPDYELTHVYTGHQMIKKLLQIMFITNSANNELPDLVIADLNSPFFEIDSIREMRMYSQFQKIPLYVIAKEPTDEITQMVLAAGATACYKKPSSFHDVNRIIGKILAQHIKLPGVIAYKR